MMDGKGKGKVWEKIRNSDILNGDMSDFKMFFILLGSMSYLGYVLGRIFSGVWELNTVSYPGLIIYVGSIFISFISYLIGGSMEKGKEFLGIIALFFIMFTLIPRI